MLGHAALIAAIVIICPIHRDRTLCLQHAADDEQQVFRIADILTEAMWRLEKAGFEIVGHVHDEVIIEAPLGKYTPEDICKVMAANPRWCMDLPLAAAGYRGDYYFKD